MPIGTWAYAQGCPCRRVRCAQQPAGDLRAHAALFSRLAYGSKQASAAQRHRNSQPWIFLSWMFVHFPFARCPSSVLSNVPRYSILQLRGLDAVLSKHLFRFLGFQACLDTDIASSSLEHLFHFVWSIWICSHFVPHLGDCFLER